MFGSGEKSEVGSDELHLRSDQVEGLDASNLIRSDGGVAEREFRENAVSGKRRRNFFWPKSIIHAAGGARESYFAGNVVIVELRFGQDELHGIAILLADAHRVWRFDDDIFELSAEAFAAAFEFCTANCLPWPTRRMLGGPMREREI